MSPTNVQFIYLSSIQVPTRLWLLLAFLFGAVCWIRREAPIGGWLMFFFYQTYSAVIVSSLAVTRAIISRPPSSWASVKLYVIFLLAVVPRFLGSVLVAVVATILLQNREAHWVRNLRIVLVVEIAISLLSLQIDIFWFPQALAINLPSCIARCIWLAYFYRSNRVQSVFFRQDWT